MTPMLGATSGHSNPNDDSETQDDMRSHKSFIILSMQDTSQEIQNVQLVRV